MSTKIAGLYDMEDTLGSGHFAVVKSARHVFTGLRVAIKVIDKTKLDDVSKAHIYQEVRCMKLVSHPSIIRLYEVIDTHNKLYLIEELGDGGDLYDFIQKNPNGVDENQARSIFRQAVSAIQYCHQLHVVHRDLKPENLVFCKTSGVSIVKLTDFGLSRTFAPGEMIESSCGSLEYSAPEILLGDFYDPPKVDVWSLGVILFMLIIGKSPFASGGANETLTHIMDGKYDVPSHVSESCKSLIGTMLVVDPLKRASLSDIVIHPWLTEGMENDPQTLVSLNVDEIPTDEVYLIVERMEAGGYGSRDSILQNIKEKPYDSIAATFYLLAEAERHRRLQQQQFTALHSSYGGGGLGGVNTRKVSVQNHMMPSPHRHGNVETGVLLPRRKQAQQGDIDPLRRTSDNSPSHGTLANPYSNPQYTSPRLGVGGEQVSSTNTFKPLFPIQSVGEETCALPDTETCSLADTRGRQLSACEEENEVDSIHESQSPVPPSPRSRRLLLARSSPNIFKSISKSDVSDEDDDDVMELTFCSRALPNRHSPLASPHLSSTRLSPTLNYGYSSDEESHASSTFDGKRRRSSKRIRYHKTIHPLVRVDSASSDDSSLNDRQLRHSLPILGKEKMRKFVAKYRNSVPSTPGEPNTSESFSDMLSVRRPRSYSARTDSSLSDTNELIVQMSEKFELSDGEEMEDSSEGGSRGAETNRTNRGNSLTQSTICCLL